MKQGKGTTAWTITLPQHPCQQSSEVDLQEVLHRGREKKGGQPCRQPRAGKGVPIWNPNSARDGAGSFPAPCPWVHAQLHMWAAPHPPLLLLLLLGGAPLALSTAPDAQSHRYLCEPMGFSAKATAGSVTVAAWVRCAGCTHRLTCG